MMNPQYLPPGQNNNAPSNPMGFPPSQDFNGINANYNAMPPNGPQKPFDQNEVTQKMQNMSINGPGYPGIPSAQLPPGQFPPGAYPPTSNFGQLPPGQRPPGAVPARPPVSGAPQFPPMKPPTPGAATSLPQAFNAQSLNNQFPPGPMQHPPSAQGPGQMPPSSQAAMPPHSQPGLPPHSQPGLPPQGGQPPRAMGTPQPGPGLPPGQGPQQGLPPQSQAGPMPPRPGMPPQPGMPQGRPAQGPLQPGIPQPGQFQGAPSQPGLPPQPGQPASQPGFPQPGQMPGQPQLPPQPGMPPQPGQMPGQGTQPGQMQQGFPQQRSQPGFPPQPGQPGLTSQPSQMPGQTGFPPQPGQQGLPPQPGQQGLPPQPGQQGLPPQPGQQGLPPQPGQLGFPPQTGQPGLPSQPGQMPGQGFPSQAGHMPGQPGLPPHPGQITSQPGLPPQPGFQQPSMPGLPHMPPPLSQQRQQFPGMPPAPQGPPGPPGPQGPPTSGAYPGMPGMGAQAGFQQPPSGYPPQFPGQQPSYPNQYQQPQKRLDPDQMPSPIQVMADDQNNRGGVFVTNDKGLVPPLVTTDFTVDDKGNASPRYIRSSMYTVPVTADLLKQTAMPFCLVVSPMAEPVGAESPPPLLDFAALTGSPTMGPVRCTRCKAYICPNMKFVDAGRHFHCAFCKATTEVPMEYTQYINSMQQYGRVPAEMALGAYEIVATKEYCRNNSLPNPPAIVFVIDVSYNSIKSGLLDTICENIMDIIAAIPKDEQTGKSWTRIGFITYSSTVHFYNIKGTLAQPQMLSVGDVSDMFVPLLEGFLSTAEDSGPVLQALLQQLPAMCRGNKETETILLPAVQAGLEALKAADTSGQLLVFHTSLPTYNAPGKLANREDRKLLNTDKEKTILNPANTAYNEVGQACCAAGVSVELFLCNHSYVDAATVGQLARLTGGQIRKYTYFTAETDGPRLVWEARRVVSRATAHDAVMRVRTSTGVRATDFYGHMYMANTTDVELAAIDADKAIGIEIKHDDKLTAEDGVYIQAALLYTHRCGQRRLRILNLALNVAHQLADVYRSMELDTCINFLTKQAVWALREHAPRAVREGLSVRCARSLAAYRRHCASPSSAGQLVLPESMKLLPLYTSCMLRSDAIAGGPDISCDDRSCAMYRALTADVRTSVVYTYPRLLPVHRLPDVTPSPLRASIDKMTDHGVYLLENGVHILIWVGSQASPEFVRDVFGVPSPQHIDTQVTELPVLDTAASAALRRLVHDARVLRRTAMRLSVTHATDKAGAEARRMLVEDRGLDGAPAYMEALMDIHKRVQKLLYVLTVMRQHDKLEAVLRHFLVEDRGVDGSASYVDYLCHVHKEIRALL